MPGGVAGTGAGCWSAGPSWAMTSPMARPGRRRTAPSPTALPQVSTTASPQSWFWAVLYVIVPPQSWLQPGPLMRYVQLFCPRADCSLAIGSVI